ncbi:MAG: hypothetical protein CL840_01645 [Crocinitomicaceae bacterium]|nr:hypothetical protein [Crocinitomicaceae bacterium]|tara:strand:- start:11500 stop:11802 length:303 start_codon:yes stop_codon:yes gene_type:complete
MPSFVPRENPTRKKEQLLDRSEELRLAILHGKPKHTIKNLAEKYRNANLSLIKARQHYHIDMEFQNKPSGINITKLNEEKLIWKQKSLDEIIAEFNSGKN